MRDTTLFVKDAKQSIRKWKITADTDNGCLFLSWGELGGAMQERVEYIERNKSGRSLEQQTILEYNSRIRKQKDKGYCEDLDTAIAQQRTNALNLPRPMLAQDIDNVSSPVFHYIQRKYNGNRCLITNIDGDMMAYSRGGKVITTLDHILEKINIPKGEVIDGEVYCHDLKLQQISSLLKKKQAGTEKLEYRLYDTISTSPFYDRLERLKDWGLEPVETIPCTSLAEAREWFKLFRAEGYEGAILRNGFAPYEDSKRSKYLIKLKEWISKEYKVIGVAVSKDNWGILQLTTERGLVFEATAPGTIEQKIHVALNPADYIGRTVTIEYAEISRDGKPNPAIAVDWR